MMKVLHECVQTPMVSFTVASSDHPDSCTSGCGNITVILSYPSVISPWPKETQLKKKSQSPNSVKMSELNVSASTKVMPGSLIIKDYL